jgi:uncharacterized membrane protein YhaH (DUF805 family)
VSFQDAVTTVLTQKYADFSGRARRSEYWWYALAAFVVYSLVYAVSMGIGTMVPYYLVALAGLVPGLAVAVRRLHDTGKSGWFVLLGLIPFVGAIVLIVFMAMDSQPGDNQYGPSPKGGAGFNTAPSANWGQS